MNAFILSTTQLVIALIVSISNLYAENTSVEDYVLDKILQPWVHGHLPHFVYVGKEPYSDRPYSWRFVDKSDPKLRTTFALDIKMEFCLKEETARRYMHAYDWQLVGVPNTGKIPSSIGDDSDIYDVRETTYGRNHASIGGWVKCRVGSCLFFIRSYSVRLKSMIDLAEQIAKSIPTLPEPQAGARKSREIAFLHTIKNSIKAEKEFLRSRPEDRVPFPLGYPPDDNKK